MTTYLKSNDNQYNFSGDVRIVLPLPPENVEQCRDEMEVYARFMRHLRLVSNGSVNIKVLSAMQFTADLLNDSDAYIAKVLVDLGLRAPRAAFPSDYLDFVDQSAQCDKQEFGMPSKAVQDIVKHWGRIGEEQFTSVRRQSVIIEENDFAET
ncbi:MAG: hypothetical protein AAGB32_01465 [Pseudomonadota bacterium]